jgi:hypothetical protein
LRLLTQLLGHFGRQSGVDLQKARSDIPVWR